MLGEVITLATLLCVFIFTILLLHWYSSPSTHSSVYILVFLGWFSSFIIITLIPYDIYLTRTNTTSVSLKPAWFLLYWVIFTVCWVILPSLNSYYRSGEFSPMLRFKDALKTEAKFLLIVGSAFAGFVVYLLVIGQMTLMNIPEIFVLLSNLWGLFLVIILLGFGLVMIPLNLWKKGSLTRKYEILQIKAANLEQKREDIIREIRKYAGIVQKLKSLAAGDPVLAECVKIVEKELQGEDPELKSDEVNDEDVKLSYKELVRIHKKVKNLVFEHKRNQW